MTEAAYVRDLQLIVEVCYMTFVTFTLLGLTQDTPRQHFYANVLPMLDEKARTVVFANVEDILLMNTVSSGLPVAPGALPHSIVADVFELPGGASEGLSSIH